jgi:TPR repeat protein
MMRCAGVALLCAGLVHCGVASDQQPTSAQIESAGIAATQGRQSAALRNLEQWAQSGMPIAQRELGLVYAATPATQTQAVAWLVRGAEGGDKEAQRVLAQAYYEGKLGLAANPGKAWPLFEAAAHQGDGRASFMLARMAKYGQGVATDLSLSVHWLQEASRQGNAQAMFLLSNAYASGDGVAHDPALSRQWLERSAEGDYPVAIQALAMALEGQAKTDPTATSAARHLLKEATDERTMKWNRYQ